MIARAWPMALVILCALFWWACAEPTIKGDSAPIGGRSFASLPPDAPVAVLTEKPARSYEVVGLVKVEGEEGTSLNALFEELKNQARFLGGEAVLITSQQDRPQAVYTTRQYQPGLTNYYRLRHRHLFGHYNAYGYPYGYFDPFSYPYYTPLYDFGISRVEFGTIIEGKAIRFRK